MTEKINPTATQAQARMSPFASASVLLLGMYLGILFVKSEVASWQRIHNMFLFKEAHMYLIISLAIVVAMLGMVTSISDGFMKYLDKSLGADYVVVPSQMILASGNVGAGPELVGKMKASPGIGDVATLRLVEAVPSVARKVKPPVATTAISATVAVALVVVVLPAASATVTRIVRAPASAYVLVPVTS
jgi:hypothetical protein